MQELKKKNSPSKEQKVAGSGRFLIINADDFGESEETDDAILTSFRHGFITSTSAFAGSPIFEKMIADLKTSKIPCGVHLSFTSGNPLSDVGKIPTLIDPSTGSFPDEKIQRSRLDKISPAELYLEFEEQIDKFLKAGFAPTHLDNHHSTVYLKGELFRQVLLLGQKYELPVRMPFDHQMNVKKALYASYLGISTSDVEILTRCHQENAAILDVKTTAFYFQIPSSVKKSSDIVKIIMGFPDGVSELCAHVGGGDERKGRETTLLCSGEITKAIEEEGIVLISYRDLKSFK